MPPHSDVLAWAEEAERVATTFDELSRPPYHDGKNRADYDTLISKRDMFREFARRMREEEPRRT